MEKIATQRAGAIRGATVSFRGDPFVYPIGDCLRYCEDSLILTEGGKITSVKPFRASDVPPNVPLIEYPDCLISSGFIDTHVHYPQLQMIGAHGSGLLDWLNRYTFRTEAKFSDVSHAKQAAKTFLQELLRSGTTTAAVYCTVHPQSVDAFFEEAERFDACMIAGKVLMDRNAPKALLDSAQQGYDESDMLIRRWHRKGRNLYGITPRFAPTSTDAQLEAAGALLRAHDGLFLQTHLCETLDEIAWVRDLFPKRTSYLDVYAHAGLVGKRTVFGHAVHASEDDFCQCHASGAALSHCPTSNLFLGSGLFRIFDATDGKRPVRVGIGTDVGGGTSICQLQSLNEAYKVAALNGRKLTATQAFYLVTLGGAKALYMDDHLGKLETGYDADLCVLDYRATSLLDFRRQQCETLEELLAVLMTVGDDRAVRATYVSGRCVYDRDRDSEQFKPAGAFQI